MPMSTDGALMNISNIHSCANLRDLLLFVVNFDHISADLAINIPSHAFDFLQIPQMDQYKATELLSGKEENISLLPYKATNVAVEGYGGKILKIKL